MMKPNVRIRFFIADGTQRLTLEMVSAYLRALNAKSPFRLHCKFRNSLIHYDLVGKGPPIVLIHGFLEDSRMWGSLSELLSAEYAVLTIDLPGHGQSDCLNYVHTMDEMAEALSAVISAEKIERPVMVGHSMGGYVMLAYAEKFGTDLGGIGLFHSTGFPDSAQKRKDRERAIVAAMKRPDLYAEMTIPNLFDPERAVELQRQIEASVEMAKQQPVQGIVANLRGMMKRPDRTSVFRSLSVPKLFVHGINDPVLELEKARKQTENVPDLTHEFLSDVGHMGHLEAPEQVSDIFKKFMKTCIDHG